MPTTRVPQRSSPSRIRLRPRRAASRIAAASPAASVADAGRLRNATNVTGVSGTDADSQPDAAVSSADAAGERAGASGTDADSPPASFRRRAITSTSPIPVSAENDFRSSRPADARLITVVSSYRDRSRSRLAAHAFPCSRLSGITSASTPPGLTLASARSRKFDARPALPWPAGRSTSSRIVFSRRDMAACSASSFPRPANDGTGTSAASWLVGRVNGGFMITRSIDRCASRNVSLHPSPCRSTPVAPAVPWCTSMPVRSNSPVPCCARIRSSAPSLNSSGAPPGPSCRPYGSRCTCVRSNGVVGWALDSIEVVRCVAAGMMSAAKIARSSIPRWIAASSPPARRCRASRAWQAAVISVPVPQAKSHARSPVSAPGSRQSASSSPTASSASSAADSGRV